MSTRLWLTAFDFARMKSSFGSKDEKLKEKLIERLRALLLDQPEGTIHVGEDALQEEHKNFAAGSEKLAALIDQGQIPREGLEDSADVVSAYILALSFALRPQPWGEDDLDEAELAAEDIYDICEQFQERISPVTLSLLVLFLDGRPLFAEGFEEYAGVYAYLTNAEIKALRVELERVHAEAQKLLDSGALNEIDFDDYVVGAMEELVQILSQAETAGHDLFIYTA